MQDAKESRSNQAATFDLAARTTDRQHQSVLDEVRHDSPGTAIDAKALEHKSNTLLDLFVGVETQSLHGDVPDVAGRRGKSQLPAPRLAEACAVKAKIHPVSLRLRHLTLEAQQQPVVGVVWCEHGRFVGDEDIAPAAQIKQVVPIRRRSREPRNLQGEDDANAPMRHVLRETLEPRPPLRAGAALPEIFINDVDCVRRPAEIRRALAERVLTLGRLAMLVYLLHRRLAQVDDGLTPQM